eukprot:GHVR01083205.1.p1 GENE.GHVR01083205.1~~GHVR01083205.1.p1  ORF type:complete len:152 (-),score=6.48 GHVR01083205.1:669-1124(-)
MFNSSNFIWNYKDISIMTKTTCIRIDMETMNSVCRNNMDTHYDTWETFLVSKYSGVPTAYRSLYCEVHRKEPIERVLFPVIEKLSVIQNKEMIIIRVIMIRTYSIFSCEVCSLFNQYLHHFQVPSFNGARQGSTSVLYENKALEDKTQIKH